MDVDRHRRRLAHVHRRGRAVPPGNHHDQGDDDIDNDDCPISDDYDIGADRLDFAVDEFIDNVVSTIDDERDVERAATLIAASCVEYLRRFAHLRPDAYIGAFAGDRMNKA